MAHELQTLGLLVFQTSDTATDHNQAARQALATLLERINALTAAAQVAELDDQRLEDAVYQLRTCLIPEEDATARSDYTWWIKNMADPPSYSQWYTKHVLREIQPTPRERFEAARTALSAHPLLHQGALMAWRNTHNQQDEDIVATMTEQLATSVQGATHG